MDTEFGCFMKPEVGATPATHCNRLFMVGQRAFIIVDFAIERGAIVVVVGVLGIELDRAVVVGLRLCDVAFAEISTRPRRMGYRHIRFYADRLGVVGESPMPYPSLVGIIGSC